MKVRITWRMQLIACVEIALCLLMAAVIWYINSYLFHTLLQQTEESRLKNFRKIETELTLFCEETESLADTIFMNSQVQTFCREPQVKDVSGIRLRQDIIAYLNQLLESDPMLHSILIQTSEGYILGSEGGYTYAALEPFGEAISEEEGASWSLLKMDAHPPQRVFSYVISSVSSYQYYTKSVKIRINLKEPAFRELYAGVSESSSPQLFLCDRSGGLISSSVPRELGGQFDSFDGQMTSSPEGSFVLDDRSQVVFSSLPGFEWIIVEKIPLEQLNREIIELRRTLTYLLLGSFAVINLFLFFFLRKMFVPLRLLISSMETVRQGEVGYQAPVVCKDEFGEMLQTFNQMSSSISDLMERSRHYEEQRVRYALAALRAQISPHFLFNTINTIKWMALAQHAEHIKSALDMLMAFLRPLFRENLNEISLREELAYEENYIGLVNLRYGGNIALAVDLPAELLERKIPCLILQPIIENCVKHGFSQNFSQARISISCCEKSEDWDILIHDNGCGLPDEALEEIRRRLENAELENGEHVGLVNVHMRLRLQYGEPYGLQVRSQKEQGTTILVKLPRI